MSNGNIQGVTFVDHDNDPSTDPIPVRNSDIFGDDESTELENWQEAVEDQIIKDIRAIAKTTGQSSAILEGWYLEHADEMFSYLTLKRRSHLGYPGVDEYELRTGDSGNRDLPNDVGAFMDLYDSAMQWLGMQDPYFNQMLSTYQRSGGGGGTGPSLSRKSFDLAQLANQANEMWKGYLLEENPDARAMAEAYVEQRISNPDQALDYQTWVLNQIKGTGRYQSIFQNKPAGLSEQQYLAPYMNSALQYVNPKDAQSLALSGAVWGASPASMQQRIMRHSDVQNSAPFIRRLEDQLSSVRGVLVG